MGHAALRRAPVAKPVHYERRRPEETTLYQVVQEPLETFLALVEARPAIVPFQAEEPQGPDRLLALSGLM